MIPWGNPLLVRSEADRVTRTYPPENTGDRRYDASRARRKPPVVTQLRGKLEGDHLAFRHAVALRERGFPAVSAGTLHPPQVGGAATALAAPAGHLAHHLAHLLRAEGPARATAQPRVRPTPRPPAEATAPPPAARARLASLTGIFSSRPSACSALA